MALPTSYTEETFEDYLKYEVLQDTAFSLGWATDIPITPVTWKVTLVSSDSGAKIFRVLPLKYPIKKDTTLSFYHRSTNALLGSTSLVENAFTDADYIVGDTVLGVVSPSVLYRAEVTTGEIPTTEPVFPSIITDTLGVLGVSDITSLTGDDLIKLRVRGRVELWHKVMAFTSFDYAYANQGGQLQRQEVYINAAEMYKEAMFEWDSLSDTVDVVVQNSQRTSVKVVW